MNTQRRHYPADGERLSLYPTSPSLSSFGAACDVLFVSFLFEPILAAVCGLREYQSGSKNITCIRTFFHQLNVIPGIYFRPDLYRFGIRLELYGANATLRR